MIISKALLFACEVRERPLLFLFLSFAKSLHLTYTELNRAFMQKLVKNELGLI